MDLQLKLLQETTDEMARNGSKKIVIVNGHGGNEHLLPYFAQAQMANPKDYVVYVLDGERSRPGGPAKKSTGVDYHAGENETSNTLYTHPELTHIDRAGRESGADQKRQNLPDFLRSEEHTSELQSRFDLVCRLLLEKKKPISIPSSILNVVIPVCVSPRMIAHWIGAAPRYLGSSDAWMLIYPLAGVSTTALGRL